MGEVYVDGEVVGTFTPQTYPASGSVAVNGATVGTFNFTSSGGVVYCNGNVIGSFSGLGSSITEYGVMFNPELFSPNKFVTGGIT